MSNDVQERLRQLQMADLGTSRREYISTVDEYEIQPRAQLAQLEATRRSNIAGTEEARQAKEDAPRLAQWANLHKTIGDTQGLENLDDLMSGQSHRANLNATSQASGGQRYPSGQARGHPGTRGNHPLPAVSSGRGGGVMGTRGRGAFSGPSKAAKFERRAVTQHHGMPPLSRLDPALDINNPDDSPRGRGGALRGHGKRRREEAPPPPRGKKDVAPVRAKRPRPMIDFSRNVSTPEAFLNVARQTFRMGPATTDSPSSATSDTTSAAAKRIEQPNPFGQTKPKTVIPPGLGPSPTPRVTATATPGSRLPPSKPGPSSSPTPRVTAATVSRVTPYKPAPSTPAAADTSANKRPVSNTPALSNPALNSFATSRPASKPPGLSTQGITGAPVSQGPASKAPAPPAQGVTGTTVSGRPVFKAPETRTPPARVPHVSEATATRSAPIPVSQRTPAGARTVQAGAVPARSTAPNPAIEPQVKKESAPETDLQKPSDHADKKNSVNLLLDVDAPAEVSSPNLQMQMMSPGCAELTGLDFASTNKPPVVSPPSTPLAQTQTQSPPANVEFTLRESVHELVETSRLFQQLVDRMHRTGDGLTTNIHSALVAGSRHGQESEAKDVSTPQPSSMGRSLVEDWLSHASADQILSLDRAAMELAKRSFEMYRSPANTGSSSGSAQKRSPDSLTPALSPRKSTASEGIFGLEYLRLSDEPPKTSSNTAGKATGSVMQTRAASSLQQSIHTSPSLGRYIPERPKAIEPRASHSKEHEASVPASSSTSTTRHAGGAWMTTPAGETEQPGPRAASGGLHPFAPRIQLSQPTSAATMAQPKEQSDSATRRGSAPPFPPGLNPFAPAYQTTRAENEAASPKSPQPTGVKFIGPPPYMPKSTGPKIIDVHPYLPKSSESTGPKFIGPPTYQPKPTGPKIIGVPPFMPNYPVVRPSTDTAQPDTSRTASPRTPSTTGFTPSLPRIIGPKPYIASPIELESTTTTEPLSPGSSNVREESSPSRASGSKHRPSPLSQWLSDSIWAREPEAHKPTPDTSRRADTKAPAHASASQTEKKSPFKVKIIGPQPYLSKD